MKKIATIGVFLALALCFTAFTKRHMTRETIYSFQVTDLHGKLFSFESLRGKKILIVNTASECGFTPQYKALQSLYERYKNKNLVVVGFPANNFGAQEPGSNAQIAQFCQKNYGVSFPMMEKISVKGADMHPIYRFLTEKRRNGVMDSQVQWNFQKYALNENGVLEKVFLSAVDPLAPEVIQWVEK